MADAIDIPNGTNPPVSDQASSVDQAKHAATTVAQTTASETKALVGDAKESARDLVGEARTHLRGQADDSAQRLVSTLRTFSGQLASMSQAPHAEGTATEVARQAADRTQQFASRIEQGGLDGVVTDAKRFARNRPGTFLAALGAGFVVGRVIKNADSHALASAAKPDPETSGEDADRAAFASRGSGAAITGGSTATSVGAPGTTAPSLSAPNPASPRPVATPATVPAGQPVSGAIAWEDSMSDRTSTSDARSTASRVGDSERDPTQPLEPDASLGELLGRLTQDFGDLVSTQVELAKVELKEEIKDAGKGAGLLGGGAFVAYLSLLLLSFAAVYGLDEVMPLGLAFLVVGLVYGVTAAGLFMQGRNKLRTVEPVPQTKASIQEDVAWAKQQKS